MTGMTCRLETNLNGLAEMCEEADHGFRNAAQIVDDPELKQLFEGYARERARFATELRAEVRRCGGDPDAAGPEADDAERGWTGLRSALTGGDPKAILAECERSEVMAEDAYRAVLDGDLPAEARAVVERQAAELRSTLERLVSRSECFE